MKQTEYYQKTAEKLVDLISKKYSYLTLRKLEFEKFIATLYEGLSEIKDNPDFHRLGLRALAEFQDVHLRMVDGIGKGSPAYSRITEPNYNLQIADSYVKEIQKRGSVSIGKIEDICYLRMNSFSSASEIDNYRWLENFGPEAKKQDKFIVDIRANLGGSDNIAHFIIEYLLGGNGPFLSEYTRYRKSGEDPDSLSKFIPGFIRPKWKEKVRDKAVLLIGQNVFSAAEWFTLRMRAIPGTTLIGDRTGGGVGRPQRYLLDGPMEGLHIKHNQKPLYFKAKFAVDIPSWLGYDSQKNLIEGKGIEPDIKISSGESIINGRDLVLERAVQELK